MSEWLIRIFIAAMVPVSTAIVGLIIHFSNRRSNLETQTRDSTAAAMTAVTDRLGAFGLISFCPKYNQIEIFFTKY